MEITDINFRTARENDITSIMDIEKKSFNEGICEKKDVFLHRIRVFQDGFYIMQYKEDIIGYLCSEMWNYKERIDEKDFLLGHSIRIAHKPQGNEIYISSMGLSPNFRGRGLGELMFKKGLNHIVKKYKSLISQILIVSEKWYNARKIYTKNGFEEVSIIEGFFNNDKISSFKDKEDGIIMRKLL